MSIRSMFLAAAITTTSWGAAHASDLKPIAGQSIKIGDLSGVAYYTVEPDGFHVVTTVARGQAGAPIRFVSVLMPGQRLVVSAASEAGALEIGRTGDSLSIREPGAASN
ncbi:hypothetical protein [Bradyrhizobium sp. WSM471]|uniref:hypothetical protein n=1 Tax=Bradyrhizobium sp. WSM471 TaxID=319017 RepID=UPI00024D2C5D|nr:MULTISPECIES: hypothetical protein [Bradyrhizobium]EHR03142.1 hypothetical protein Bra471DRAFT_03910 [Bradyrhizobium sp. WSM471]UFW38377.1 hypothetical protein BcanWSM471_19180 [Bradyrhizobium canariense]